MNRRVQIKVLVREQVEDEQSILGESQWINLGPLESIESGAVTALNTIWSAIHYHSREIDKLKREADD